MSAFMGYSFALMPALITIYGDYHIKVAAQTSPSPRSISFLIGATLYATGALTWFLSVRQITLAQAGVAYSMLTLLAICALGVIVFEEKLHLREMLGIACALLSMILMIRYV